MDNTIQFGGIPTIIVGKKNLKRGGPRISPLEIMRGRIFMIYFRYGRFV
jgi:hypothetical protein